MIYIAYKTISYGSSGDDVRKLQERLNKEGYSLAVDGQFGSKTQAAVRDYQKKKGLSVDGIVGKNTWGALNTAPKSTTTNNKNSSVNSKNNFSTPKPQYEKSQAVLSAEQSLKNWEKNSPDEYKSKYSEKIDEILGSILNREEFKYSMSADPLYEQYKELYMLGGKKAMMDTVGNSAALTGGYNNSYAQVAGQQVYDDYLTQLNDIALDLRDRAFEEYKYEGDTLVRDAQLLRNLEGDDYEKYLQELQRYYEDGDYLLRKLSDMSDSEFEAFAKELGSWENDRDYAFKQYKDALDREEFEKELAFKKAEAQRDQANEDRNYALARQKAYSSGSSGSSGKSKGESTGEVTIYPTTYKEFYARTGVANILTETQFKASTPYMQAYKGKYTEYLKAMYKKYK